MSDLISRQAAIDEIARWIGYLDEDMICRIQIGLKRLPPAQPEGKWILETYQIRCSHCNKLFSDYLFPSNYCPNCGARMDGESDG